VYRVIINESTVIKSLKASIHLQTLSANSFQTSFFPVLSVFANSPQTDVLCSFFPVGNENQDTMFASVDVFLNTSSVYRELQRRQVLRMWTSENTLKLDILQSFVATLQNRLVSFWQNF
jgi:hypothetical protein